MITVRVCMKVSKEPLKRTPVLLQLDLDCSETEPVLTDRAGVARFDVAPGSGRVLVSGIERYHGRLDGEILVDLWSITQSGNDSAGMPGEFPAGSICCVLASVIIVRIEFDTCRTSVFGRVTTVMISVA